MTALEQQLLDELENSEKLNTELIKRLDEQESSFIKQLQEISDSNKKSNEDLSAKLEALETKFLQELKNF